MSTHSDVSSRLFLSADLVGSTARKQAQGPDTWIGDVLAFYQQFPSLLDRSVAEAEAAKAGAVSNFELHARPTLWKPVGDELIYTAEVRSEHDVCVLVDAWIKAMRATEEIVLGKAAMDLKGASWIATFPLPDRAIAVPMDPSIYERDLEPEVINRELLSRFDGGEQEKVRVDYLGPSIDIGFRVASRATARRFMLSFEAAWAVAVSRTSSASDHTPLYFQGEIELKGVWNGRGYPLFWLDTGNHHSARTILDQIAGLDPTPRDVIRELAGALRTAGDWPCRLYLPGSTHKEFALDHVELQEASERLASVSDTSREVPDLPEEY